MKIINTKLEEVKIICPTIYEDNFDSEFLNSLGIKASKNEEVLNLIRDNSKHTYKIEKNEFDYRIDLIIDRRKMRHEIHSLLALLANRPI